MGIDILIPVLGRPQNAEPLVESIVFNTVGPYRIVFICSPGDDEQIAACRKTGQDTWIIGWENDRANYARKINWAFPQTTNEWVFSGADDIRFSPGWDSKALSYGAAVIGTNDLHNPSVKKGHSATHILFKRSYIEEQGGTYDGSGLVFSEAYDHQCVDVEFVETAIKRGVWAFAKDSHVEHFHPNWGNAPDDPTYVKSFREARQDRKLLMRRIARMKRVRKR